MIDKQIEKLKKYIKINKPESAIKLLINLRDSKSNKKNDVILINKLSEIYKSKYPDDKILNKPIKEAGDYINIKNPKLTDKEYMELRGRSVTHIYENKKDKIYNFIVYIIGYIIAVKLPYISGRDKHGLAA